MPPRGDVQLSIGYWLVSHKATLRTWWAVSLLAFTLLALIWGLTFTIIFFSQTPALDRRLAQTTGQLAQTAIASPAALKVSPVTVISRDSTHIDLVATLTNPNLDWGADTLTFHFALGNHDIPAQRIFANPGQDRPIVALNVPITPGGQTEASVIIDVVSWSKAASATLPAANFVVDSADLTPTVVTIGGQSVNTVNLKAVVTNRSVYNFRHVVVPMVIKEGNVIVAVDQITTDAWPTLTSRTLTATWPFALSGQLTAEVVPQVSRFDSDNVYR